ncbi:peptidyl-alpha-hydroxyglycine alpha-amidating lyase 2-like [Nilaparvata lugens]|uniref:peptidyl-alpha-hydroxyglycine alpha-amidating lyase 2-like n=1 Tax=Nilaparvata lugens TaxID=108931 RepID=UPI00193D762C|nr:peptidyl-alpha-hydroxyglycine alpha-amidating lyase 2-like [Nilaparvata lugens]
MRRSKSSNANRSAGAWKMAGVGLLSLIFLSWFSVSHATSLRDVFYNEIHSILDQPRLTQVLDNAPLHPQEVVGWPKTELKVGQISGVTVNNVGQPVIFHRADRVWDSDSFDSDNRYKHEEKGPIEAETIYVLDPEDGNVLQKWGANFFYMPHGITIDRKGNVYLTDVALHQVFKFAPQASRPSLTLGKRMEPGSGHLHFCKPTSVAVANNGQMFVADGYCNSRIMKFDSDGRLVRIFPQRQEFLSLQVPHSVTLLEQRDLLCIADRDDMRVACIGANLYHTARTAAFTIQQPDMGRVFAIASRGDFVYAVNGPTSQLLPVKGFTLDPMAENVIDHWGPKTNTFTSPHSIAISPDGKYLYVSEIGPNRIWKFLLKSTETPGDTDEEVK